MGEEPKVIRAGRRRHAEPAPPEGRERAEAPHRETSGGQSDSSGGYSGAGGGGDTGGYGGGALPQIPLASLGKGKFSCLGLVVLVVIIGCVLILQQFLGNTGDGTGLDLPADTQQSFAQDTQVFHETAIIADTQSAELLPPQSARKKTPPPPKSRSLRRFHPLLSLRSRPLPLLRSRPRRHSPPLGMPPPGWSCSTRTPMTRCSNRISSLI
jgi:hypothetical protein